MCSRGVDRGGEVGLASPLLNGPTQYLILNSVLTSLEYDLFYIIAVAILRLLSSL